MTYRLTLAALVLAAPTSATAQTLFRFPAVDPQGTFFMDKPIIHVDHDPVDAPQDTACVNYKGLTFPFCYDQHDGTDFLLLGGFATMDAHGVEVVAAADGVVVEAVDGNYDRCHGDLTTLKVDCDGHPMVANHVVIKHADGLETLYYHLKKGSVKVKQGQSVQCGDLLGHVGSSGRSATPHLHFEVRDMQGQAIDPFSGPKSQAQTYWTTQNGAFDRPAERCQGAPPLVDGGPELDAGPDPDATPASPDADLDAGAPGRDSTFVIPPLASGCAVGRAHGSPKDPLAPLVLLALLCVTVLKT